MPVQAPDSHITADAKSRFGDQALVLPSPPRPISDPIRKLTGADAREIEQTIDTASPGALTKLRAIKETNPEAFAVILSHLQMLSEQLEGKSFEVPLTKRSAKQDGVTLLSDHIASLYRLYLDTSIASASSKRIDLPTLEFVLSEDRKMLGQLASDQPILPLPMAAPVSSALCRFAYHEPARFDALVDGDGRKVVATLFEKVRAQGLKLPDELLVAASRVLSAHTPGSIEAENALGYLIDRGLAFEKVQPGLGSEYFRLIEALPSHDVQSLRRTTDMLGSFVSGLARQGETRLREAVASLTFHKGEIELSDDLLNQLVRLNRSSGLVFSSRLVASNEPNKQALLEKRISHLLEGYENPPQADSARLACFVLAGSGDIFGDALSHSTGNLVGQLLDNGYRVHLFEIGEEAQFPVALARSAAFASRPPELLLLSGHGTESQQMVGVLETKREVDGQGIALAVDMLAGPRQVDDAALAALEQGIGLSERTTLDAPSYVVRASGHTQDSAHLDIEDQATFAEARKHLAPSAKAIVLACGSGTSAYEQSASRKGRALLGPDSKRSFGKEFADSISLPVFAASEAITSASLVFDAKGEVVEVKFDNGPLGDVPEARKFLPLGRR